MECFSVFFCIFSVFLPWNRLPEFFCVSQSLFSIFFSGRIGGILLSPYVVAQLARVGPFIHGFSSFSVCLLHVLRSATGWRTCFCSFNVGSSFSEVLVAVFSSCFEPHDFAFKRDCSCSGPRSSSVRPNFHCCVSCREPHCPFSSVALPLFPALFPAFVSSSALDVASLFSSAAGTLKLPSFCVSLHLSPQALARPFLAWWFQAPIIASYVFSSVSLHSESLVCVVQLMYMFGLSHAPFLAKLITSGELG